MPVISFSLTRPKIKPGILLSCLETVISQDKIAEAIAKTKTKEKRNRFLPTHVVIVLIIAMSFWATDSIVDVFKNILTGLNANFISQQIRLKIPSSSSISEARQRVGPRVMTHLFESIVRPLATFETPGAFLGGLRLMAIDGTVFDIPETEKNAKVFGYPGTRKGTKAAFALARMVFLVECGTHLIIDALLSPYRIGERVRAKKLLRGVGPKMLLMWDRGLHSFKMVYAALLQKCHILGRVPANVKFEAIKTLADGSYLSKIYPDRESKKKGAKPIQVRVIEYRIETDGVEKVYRLITDLCDVVRFPALLLAKEYHSRWEAENTLDELKTHLNGRKTLIRSKNPREVIQEIYGWLIAHYCLRVMMFRAAETEKISPLQLGFTGTLKVIRRAIPLFQQANSQELNLFYSWFIAEILDNKIPKRVARVNPRVVKKARSKFKSAKAFHRGQGTQLQQLNFQIYRAA